MTTFPLNPNYSVSPDGKIFSHISNKFLKQRKNKFGYLFVRIRIDGKKKSIFIHRLVAITYIPNPEGKKYVNHKNGYVNDNRFENLEWVTGSQNARHKFDVLGFKFTTATKAKMSKENFSTTLGYIPRTSTFDGYWYDNKPYASLTDISKEFKVSLSAPRNWFKQGLVRSVVDGEIQPLNAIQIKAKLIYELRRENSQ